MAELPRAIVVMGVSGSGKTTLGQALAERLGYTFVEADDLHCLANVAKMSSGVPLDDADREPWLRDVGAALNRAANGGGGVVACSALKRLYRDRLRSEVSDRMGFVHPVAPQSEIERRLDARAGHFMPASLAASQFEALEPLGPDELSATVDAVLPTGQQVVAVIAALERGRLA